jgi:hypothetical protein
MALRKYPLALREKFHSSAEQLSILSITLGELLYGAEKSGHHLSQCALGHSGRSADDIAVGPRLAAGG